MKKFLFVLMGMVTCIDAMAQGAYVLTPIMELNEAVVIHRSYYSALSSSKPAALAKDAGGMQAPLYGTIHIGDKDHFQKVTFAMVMEGENPKLVLDSNMNGDLSDDAAATWSKTISERSGAVIWSGKASVLYKVGGKERPVNIRFTIYRAKGNERAPEGLVYFPEYGYTGQITLADKKYAVLLTEGLAKGDNVKHLVAGRSGNAYLRFMIDIDGDGAFKAINESYHVSEPFNIGGTTYEIKNLNWPEGTFEVVKSAKNVEEIHAMKSLTIGTKAPEFKAVSTTGQMINFPGDFKGKVVLIDFWATWCGPCRKEMPFVIDAYNRLHGKGLEIIGVSLDQQANDPKIAAYTAENKIEWPMICDGKYWNADLAKQYGVTAIPAAFIVDGDTGTILGMGESIRGEKLIPAIEKALK